MFERWFKRNKKEEAVSGETMEKPVLKYPQEAPSAEAAPEQGTGSVYALPNRKRMMDDWQKEGVSDVPPQQEDTTAQQAEILKEINETLEKHSESFKREGREAETENPDEKLAA